MLAAGGAAPVQRELFENHAIGAGPSGALRVAGVDEFRDRPLQLTELAQLRADFV